MTLAQVLALLDQVDGAVAAYATTNPGRYGQYEGVSATNRMVVEAIFTEVPYSGNAVSPSGDQVA